MKILGIDPGIELHRAAVYCPALRAEGECKEQRSYYTVGALILDPGALVIHDNGPRATVTAVNLQVLEMPEYQGNARDGGWFLKIHKRAAMLLERLRDYNPGAVYCAPTRVIRGDRGTLKKATASDADVLAWLREHGVPTGRGTPFTHELSGNSDALLAALWGWIEWQRHGIDSKYYDPLGMAS